MHEMCGMLYAWLMWSYMHMSVLQEHAYDQEKVAHLVQNCHTTGALLREMCKVYAERPMFGFCEPGSCQWQTITYKQAYARVEHLAAGAWTAYLPMCPSAPLPVKLYSSSALWHHSHHVKADSGHNVVFST